MNGLRVFAALMVASAATMLAPTVARAEAPGFNATLEYGPGGEATLVVTATVTSGSPDFLEIWLGDATGAPIDVVFTSSNPAINATCLPGVREERGFVACIFDAPAPPGTTLTVSFSLPAPFAENGGALLTMMAPPGGPANTTVVAVSGPTKGGASSGGGIRIELLPKFMRQNKAVKVEAQPDPTPLDIGAKWFIGGLLLIGARFDDSRGADASKKTSYDLKGTSAQLQPGLVTTVSLKVPRAARKPLDNVAEAGKKVKLIISATGTSSSGQPLEDSETEKLKPKG